MLRALESLTGKASWWPASFGALPVSADYHEASPLGRGETETAVRSRSVQSVTRRLPPRAEPERGGWVQGDRRARWAPHDEALRYAEMSLGAARSGS